MQQILALALGGMQNDMARLDQVAMNLSNAVTPGYKRGVLVQRPNASVQFAAAMLEAADSTAPATSAALPVSMAIDARPGTLKATSQSLDVAIGGVGFFEVATERGPAYTRQGNFRADAQGRLVTAKGDPVMGTGGEIFLGGGAVTISPKGVVSERGQSDVERVIGQIKLMQFPPDMQPERLGDGLLMASPAMTETKQEDVQMRQGFVENSNVDTAHEMTQLIRLMRHFESMNRIAQSHDDMLGTAIRRLGENS